MRKHYLFILSLLLYSILSSAQQDNYHWRVGIHGGLMNYYGDLSYQLWDPNVKTNDILSNLDYISYGVSIEKSFSPAWSLRLQGSMGEFIANDRTIKSNGDLKTSNPDFARSLNARTELRDLSMLFQYHFDNDIIFSKTSFLAPYLSFGGGFSDFEVFGDLYTGNGQRYYYWSDYSIRDVPESSGLEGNVIEQDGVFETNLSDLNTEGKDYSHSLFHLSAGLGIKLRLSGRLNLNLETIVHFTNTDYLDDVSGNYPEFFDNPLQAYASNPNQQRGPQRGDSDELDDVFAFTSLSLHYNFGRRKEAFKAPVIFTRTPSGQSPIAEDKINDKQVSNQSASIRDEKKSVPQDSVYTELQHISDKIDTLSRALLVEKIPSAEKGILETRIDSLEAELGRLKQQQQSFESTFEKELQKALLRDSSTVVIELDSIFVVPTAPQIKETPSQVDSRQIDTVYIPLESKQIAPEKRDTIFIKSQEATGKTYAQGDLEDLQEQVAALETSLTRSSETNKKDTVAEKQLLELKGLRQQLMQYQNTMQQGNAEQEDLKEIQNAITRLQVDIVGIKPETEESKPDTIIIRSNDSLKQVIQALNQELSQITTKVNQLEKGAREDTLSRLLPDWELLELAQLIKKLERQIDETEREKDLRIDQQNQQIQVMEQTISRMKMQIDFLNKQMLENQNNINLQADSSSLLADKIKDRKRQIVFFTTGSVKISPNSEKVITDIVALMNEHSRLNVIISGYTDTSGNPDYNRKLALQRAQSVADNLQKRGIERERMTIRGIGEDINAKADYGRRAELELIIR